MTNFLFTFFSHFPFPLSVYIPIFDFDQKFGARIVIEGAHILESKKYAEVLCLEEGLTYVNGYDDPPIIAGAGTIGMEVSRNISFVFATLLSFALPTRPLRIFINLLQIVEDVPDVDAVVVPVGGAGLIAGVACAVKTLKPDCKVGLDGENDCTLDFLLYPS